MNLKMENNQQLQKHTLEMQDIQKKRDERIKQLQAEHSRSLALKDQEIHHLKQELESKDEHIYLIEQARSVAIASP